MKGYNVKRVKVDQFQEYNYYSSEAVVLLRFFRRENVYLSFAWRVD